MQLLLIVSAMVTVAMAQSCSNNPYLGISPHCGFVPSAVKCFVSDVGITYTL